MSSNSAPDSTPSKPQAKKTTFFCDFDKKTSSFWDRCNYSLGRQFELNASPLDKSNLKIKVKDGKNVTTTAKAEFQTKWGSVEVEEHSKNGTTARFHVDNVYRQWNLRSRHCVDEVEVTADCRPEGSFWAAEVGGKYVPNNESARVCTSECSISVHDNQYDLAVGGKLELEDCRERGTPLHYQSLLKSYSMGFLYTPTENTQYSLIYKPDNESNGITYDFSLFKKVSDSVSVAARAEGKADLRIVSPPVLSLGASWSNNGNFFRGFLNNRKEFGASYQVRVNPNVNFTLGLASLLCEEELETSVGFKLSLS